VNIEQLSERLAYYADRTALIYEDKIFSYQDILQLIAQWQNYLATNKIEQGAVIAVIGDYAAQTIALIIALIQNRNIIVPLTPSAKAHFEEYFEISQTQYTIELVNSCHLTKKNLQWPQHPLLKQLAEQQQPGLILFTSGSTGKPKAVVHNFDKLLSKFVKADKSYRTLCFLMFDHIAGIDTYFYTLYSGGTVVFPVSRQPADICQLIDKHQIEVLPTSPTFLNLLLISKVYRDYHLDSLKAISFGSERMSKSLLTRLNQVFPHVKLLQKYGVTELGSPSSKSMAGDSTWIKINSEQFQTKIVNGILHVKAETAMLGYLNAPSPFTEGGWFDTGDSVETDGDYIHILGRESEIINIGGEKVYPAEIEEIIQMMPEVEDVVVNGISNPITGEMVQAQVKINTGESRAEFRKRMRAFCQDKLQPFKIPQKVILSSQNFYNNRFKKIRM
jgi:long-chain acyl-CoA synthetase